MNIFFKQLNFEHGNISENEIKRTYKRLAKQLHPDMNPHQPTEISKLEFIKLNNDYQEAMKFFKEENIYQFDLDYIYNNFFDLSKRKNIPSELKFDLFLFIEVSLEDFYNGFNIIINLPNGKRTLKFSPSISIDQIKKFPSYGLLHKEGVGDLYIRFKIKPSKNIYIKNNDIFYTKYISLIDFFNTSYKFLFFKEEFYATFRELFFGKKVFNKAGLLCSKSKKYGKLYVFFKIGGIFKTRK